MERRGPDSLEGWFIAFICCLISTLMYGAAGLSGLLFVASVVRYDTDRDQASFPYILSTVLQAVSGPFAGYFASRFGSRIVILVGSILGFLGIATCFFAEDIVTVTVLWGVVFGIGFGLSSLLLPAIVNEYFFKHRSIALGMCYLGSPIGFLIFPPIFETLLNKYGLSGTFLILAGINMHCLPLSVLLKPPNFKIEHENSPLKYGEKHDYYSSTKSTTVSLNKKFKSDNNEEPKINGDVDSFGRRHSIEFLWKPRNSKEQVADKKYVLSLTKKCCCEEDDRNIQRSFRKTSKNIYENFSEKYIKCALHSCVNRDNRTTPLTTALDKNDKKSNHLIAANNTCYQKHESSLPYIDTPTRNQSVREKTLLPQHLKNHEYEVVSTIYFGTNQNTYIPRDCESHEKKYSDEKNTRRRTESVLRFPNHMKSDSMFDSAYSQKIPVLLKYEKTDDFFRNEISNVHAKETIPESFSKNTTHSQNLILNMYLNPVFILICLINSVINLHFTCLTTVIIDFSRDHDIGTEYETYIMMVISLGGIFGMMGFGWVTDGGFMTRTNFGCITQLISSICTALLPFTVGLYTLLIALLIWCVCQSSFIPLIPAITADYFEEKIQAVAVSACNVLCGPLYLIIPPLIGYFRDNGGSYDNIFFLLSSLAFMDCVIVLAIPYLAKEISKKNVK